jgi:hypothetical protein
MALADLIHNWNSSLETPGKAIRIIFLDYRKAFDLVDHNLVIQKLKSMGVPDFLLKWIQSFLCERQNKVKVGSTFSKSAVYNAGVPQGTLLGPMLFLSHINDLKPSNNVVKYVDDTTLWEVCAHDGHDSTIQQSADEVMSWSSDNRMQLNTDKTKEMVIYFGRKPAALAPITMQNSNIERVTTFKLLGVTINNQLTWQEHVHNICQKASQRLYFLTLLRRAGIDPMDIIKVYCSIVRSVLEYAAIIWHPGLTCQQSSVIEHIQKRALKIAYPELSYETALQETNMERLDERREQQCLNFFKDIQCANHKLHHYLPQNPSQRQLRRNRKFVVPKARTNRLKKSPIFYGLFNYQCF